jgi:hypothetical protein
MVDDNREQLSLLLLSNRIDWLSLLKTPVQGLRGFYLAFHNVGLRGAAVMHLNVLIGAVAKNLRAPRPEVGEPGDVPLGRRGGCLVEV